MKTVQLSSEFCISKDLYADNIDMSRPRFDGRYAFVTDIGGLINFSDWTNEYISSRNTEKR